VTLAQDAVAREKSTGHESAPFGIDRTGNRVACRLRDGTVTSS